MKKVLQCYICDDEFKIGIIEKHINECTYDWNIEEVDKPEEERIPVPLEPAEFTETLQRYKLGLKKQKHEESTNPSEKEFYPVPSDQEETDTPANEQAHESSSPEAKRIRPPSPPSDLVKCQNCQRTFFPEKLTVHQKICKPGKPLQRTKKGQNQKYQPPKPGKKKKWAPPPEEKKIGMNHSFEQDQDANEDPFENQNAQPSSTFYPPAEEPLADANDDRIPCSICGRKFFPDRIEKHENVCVNQKKRKKFDTKAHRIVDESQKQYGRKKKTPEKRKKGGGEPMPGEKVPKWKKQSESLKQAMKMNRKIKQVADSGGDIRQLPTMPSANDDYVECQYCYRRFSEEVAERHIPNCKKIINRPKPPKHIQKRIDEEEKKKRMARKQMRMTNQLPKAQMTKYAQFTDRAYQTSEQFVSGSAIKEHTNGGESPS